MKAESILKTDILDIIFQNKNKDYGAYQLRKYYPSRLKKSISITLLLVLVFAGLQSWKTPKKNSFVEFGLVNDVTLFDYKPPVEKIKQLEKASAVKKQVKQVANVVPTIIKELFNDKPLPTIDQINDAVIGSKNIDGPATTDLTGVKPGDPTGVDDGKKNGANDGVELNDNEPIFDPSNMPEFSGGLEAMKNFMLKNLRQPDDIDEGQKIVIIVKFVVDKDGSISNVEVLQNGREDLDEEVQRVIQKMPKWKPGLQNGLPVAVYYKMPVTFVNSN